MKYGVHLALWMESWHDDVTPYIAEAAQIGFDGVELSLLGLVGGSDPGEAVGRIRRAVADAGLELTCTTGLGPDSDVTSDDPAVRGAGVAYLEQAIDTVHALGSSLLSGVIYAPWGKRQAAGRETRWQRAVDALRRVAPRAEARGVTLGIEAINRYETDLVTTAAQAVRMADEVGHPNVGVLLDSYHMNIEERRPADALRAAGERLVHLHAVANDRGAPGSGPIAWDEIAVALREIGYDGWVTLEMFVRPDLPVSPDLAVWRPVASDPSEAARRGLAFLRERFA